MIILLPAFLIRGFQFLASNGSSHLYNAQKSILTISAPSVSKLAILCKLLMVNIFTMTHYGIYLRYECDFFKVYL